MQITKNNSLVSQQPKSLLSNLNKDELVRLLLQSLRDLGYSEAASSLEVESGISLESEVIIKLRSSILNGEWQAAELLLPQLPLISNPLQVQFLIRQQKFLELLEQSQTMQALHVLRNEITPLKQNTERLHLLSSLILCTSVEDVMQQASWDGKEGSSREKLLNDIQCFIDPIAMIPKHRLLTLIQQAMDYQKSNCLYHYPTKDTEYSLLADHQCDKNALPTTNVKVLVGHTDEIWHVAYSHNGKYLASVSKDQRCIIWDMETYNPVIEFTSEVSGSYCAWSPDDTKLLVCGIDYAIRLYDVTSGILLQTFHYHSDQVTCCAWLPDNQHFFSGACDKTLCLWDYTSSNTRPVNHWTVKRTTDMKLSEDGKRFVTIGLDKYITVYDVVDFDIQEIYKLPEENVITSLTLTRDGKHALVNIQHIQELHLWDLEKRQIVHKYSGQKQLTYIIRSALGGHNESFVLSGSEDNHVYIWSREHETLLQELEGHEKTVNCVSWCPVEPMRFVSASDDHTIRLWAAANDFQ